MWNLSAAVIALALGLALATRSSPGLLRQRLVAASLCIGACAGLVALGFLLREAGSVFTPLPTQLVCGSTAMACGVVLIDRRSGFERRDVRALSLSLVALMLGLAASRDLSLAQAIQPGLMAAAGGAIGSSCASRPVVFADGVRLLSGVVCAGAGAQLIGELLPPP